MRSVLFVAFESLPFVKTGGLADVVGTLPQSLDPTKYEVKVVLPLLKQIKDKWMDRLSYVDHIYINSGIIHEEANIYNLYLNNLEYIFIENDTYFYRDGVYGYNDDVIRFAVFNNAVLEMMIKCDYYPDICHEHDYHTAILPALCKVRYNAIERIRNIKHILTIHNLAFQGVYNKKVLFDFFGFEYRYFEDGSLRFNDDANLMKAGIVYADIVTTVSRTYSYEIQSPEFGENLEAVLQYRSGDLYGIVNGIDTTTFDPNKDPDIRMNYNLRNWKAGKRANKEAVQEMLGLQVRPNTFLVGMISRLTSQKGVDLLISSIDHWMQRDCEIAILGTGDSKYEYQLKMMEERYKTRCVYYCGYNEALAHQLYAGLDMLLMPSKFEPCGISQLIAMHYGTLPLVRETGGLRDTVEPYNEYTKEGRGFSFGPYDLFAMQHVFDYAYDTYYDRPQDWSMMIKNAMKYDVSFAKSAKEYEEVYERALNK